MTTFRVVLDACVLLPQNLNNLLLTIAESELFSPVWSDELLGEVERNLCGEKFQKTAEQAAHRVNQMRAAFPLAEEESHGYESLIPAMTNDPKDRHVLAAAVRSRADIVVTLNLKDFPRDSVEPHGIEAVHPDALLCDQFDLDRRTLFECLSRVAERNRKPPQSVGELLDALESITPEFVETVRSALNPGDGPRSADREFDFESLTDDQVRELPAELQPAYEMLKRMDPVERAQFLGHVPIVSEAWSFLRGACIEGDLRAVWNMVDPDLRAAFAKQWVADNMSQLVADGWDAAETIAGLAGISASHPLWEHFQRVHVRSLRHVLPDPETWGIGSGTRIVSPGVELLYLHDMSTMPDGVWQPDEGRWVFPILMHLVDGRWLVRNLGTDEDPRAGAEGQ